MKNFPFEAYFLYSKVKFSPLLNRLDLIWINPLDVTLYCMLLFHKIFFFFIALGCISFFLFLMKMYPYDLQQFMIRWGQKKASYMQKPRWEFSEGPKNFKGSCLTSILVSTNFSFLFLLWIHPMIFQQAAN